MARPKKLVFIHIPKTAGTSLKNLLESNYAEDERLAIYNRENLDEKLAAALKDPKIRCIYGHFPLRPVVVESDAVVVTLFREPVARTISHYNHYKRGLNEEHRRIMEGVNSPEDFAKLPQGNNRQTAFISGHLKNADFFADPHALERAMQNLQRIDFAGFTEHFNASIALFKKELGWKYAWSEHSNSGSKKNEADLETWRSLNELDLPLVDAAWDIFYPAVQVYEGKKINSRPGDPTLLEKIKYHLRVLSSKFRPK